MFNEAKRLIVDEQLVTKGRMVDAICQVQIFKVENSNRYQVVLSRPKVKNYQGRSTTNHFEVFATEVKKRFSADIDAAQIDWFNYLEWNNKDMESFPIRVELDFVGGQFGNAQFMERV